MQTIIDPRPMEPIEILEEPTSQIDWSCEYEDGTEDWGTNKQSLLAALHKAGAALENASFAIDTSESKDFPENTPPCRMYFNQIEAKVNDSYSWRVEYGDNIDFGTNLKLLLALVEQLVDDRENFNVRMHFSDEQ